MADIVRVDIDQQALRDAVSRGEGLSSVLSDIAGSICGRANSMSAGFRTGLYHVDHESPAVGDTQPEYAYDVQEGKRGPVGLVWTNNYSAMKDCYENNTLLKARG